MVCVRGRWVAGSVALVLALTASCADRREYPGDEVGGVPGGAVGAVVVGPLGLEAVGDEDRTMLFVFDQEGRVVGKAIGAAVSNSRVLAGSGRIVTSFADSVSALAGNGREQFGIERESIVQAAAGQPGSGAATIWYNTGVVNGEYVNRFVSIGAGEAMRAGQVAGIVGTTSYCGESNYAVVRQSFVGTEQNPTKNWLYALGANNTPVARGQWDYDPEFRPVTTTSACTEDGGELVTLYASEQTATGTGTGLTLVRFRTADGARTETALHMPDFGWETHRGSLTVAHGKLYWITRNGDVLSVPLDGTNTVAKEWTVHGPRDKVALSVHGPTVSAISYRGKAEYSRYELATGRRLAGPVALPWLDDIEGSETESGGSIYSVADMTGLG
ncbi:hypothetical protein NBRGN_078_00030 [Nocardia brasiliensis NBRC 14402]|nr:hypothetical protein NBRGN_078_00030 [Nocardia brasiliensis NBRC 14402]SUB48180.1 Uncharacterised protein [Nocardia brasiliensis]